MSVYPDLTIATTLHNNLDRWMEMASSFEREAGLPAEIVAVDDASAIPAVISGLQSPVRIFRNETARGFCAASDQALREVKTPFAFLLDADITFLPGDFRAAFDSFKSVPQLAWSNFQQISAAGTPGSSCENVIAPAWIYALGNQITGRWLNRAQRRLHPRPINDRIENVPIAHSSSALVRMNALREIDGFDLRYWQCQSDNDLCLRLTQAGWLAGVDRLYTVRHDGVGGRTGGLRRIYDLYRGKLLFYETHDHNSRLYLRLFLALRHLLEALALLFRHGESKDHLRPSFRLQLALCAVRGYPRNASP
ncbi:MAG TPA: glycosyltransferase [Candidatus Methylacidiphilales bacterium]|nr:glycosyltransferase [Candidatus Methylacidiphilales bacterium]